MTNHSDDEQLVFGTEGPAGTDVPKSFEIPQEKIVRELRSVSAIEERYTDIEPINQGGMGQVFKARDRNLRRAVAIKQMLRGYIGNQDAIKRFLRETQIAGGLNHPHIITVYDSGMSPLGPYLVMEYATGGDLGTLCQTGALDPSVVIEYGIQICKALKRTHQEGIIHRDIKPQNILLQSHDPSEPFVAKIADFGLAWGGSQSLMSQPNAHAGTAYYRSPEQTLGSKAIDARSDIYSLGATLYHLLTGIPPIQFLWERVPDTMRELISTSTKWTPEDRYASVKEMQQALEDCRNDSESFPKSTSNIPTTHLHKAQAPVLKPQGFSALSTREETSPMEFINSLGMKFSLIPAGQFVMGSPKSEKGRFENETQHEVIFTRPFYMGVYPVTRGEFQAFVKESGYRTEAESDGQGAYYWTGNEWKKDPKIDWRTPGFQQEDTDPIVCVSWNDAQAYCRWLNLLKMGDYRLPTESEWEYACRANSVTSFFFGDDGSQIDEYGWYHGNRKLSRNAGWFVGEKRKDGTQPVGQKKPNDWGLHDMHGNVWEWCSDWYGAYPGGAVTNPKGPSDGLYRVFRGGGWGSEVASCRSARRFKREPFHRSSRLGIRLALSSTGISPGRGTE
jgi:formylglycine-generating enzyme required for sulfatase activity/tRNA A-37 threonylcarbamoyl transferase component Bud32